MTFCCECGSRRVSIPLRLWPAQAEHHVEAERELAEVRPAVVVRRRESSVTAGLLAAVGDLTIPPTAVMIAAHRRTAPPTATMKNYYRVMLGKQSAFAEQCFAGNFIGTDFEIAQDLTGKLPEKWRDFNKEFIPVNERAKPARSERMKTGQL